MSTDNLQSGSHNNKFFCSIKSEKIAQLFDVEIAATKHAELPQLPSHDGCGPNNMYSL